MSKAGLASAVLACLPAGVMEQILEIWEKQSDRRVVLNFKGGRCLKIEVTGIQQFGKDDFGKGGAG